jgi:hypothetical protein
MPPAEASLPHPPTRLTAIPILRTSRWLGARRSKLLAAPVLPLPRDHWLFPTHLPVRRSEVIDLSVDLQRSRPSDAAEDSRAPVVFKFPRDGHVLDDWFVRATVIASRWLPLSRPVIRAEITCLAHPRTTGRNASCIACIGIAKHQATSRPTTSNQTRWHSVIHRRSIDERAAQIEALAGDLTTRC